MATRFIAMCRAGEFYWSDDMGFTESKKVTRAIMTLATSCLSQDEQKGQAKKKRRGRK